MKTEQRYSGWRQRAIRRSKDIPQWKLGVRIGQTQPVISRFETGEKIPSPDVQLQIAAILGVDLSELMEPAEEIARRMAI